MAELCPALFLEAEPCPYVMSGGLAVSSPVRVADLYPALFLVAELFPNYSFAW